MRRVLATLAIAAALAAGAARAEDLAAGISRDKIEITSSFTGTDVVVFGAIELESGEALPATEMRDVVVVIRSDKPYLVTVRKKDQVGPIWMNRDQRRFAGVPGYYFLSSTRPLKDIASAEVLEQFEIGLDRIALGPAPGAIGGPREFREAILRTKMTQDLYSQHEGAVSFLSGSLFRTTVALPPNVPAGHLKVLVYAFADGQVTSSSTMTLFIDKTGIERGLSEFAHHWPLFYGLAAVLLSALAGFLASLAFRERH
ncbi:MAG: TIGR02186 family protein [Alphaproteobacteria bacterium]|nr:TIGR02186 family protein [Alphaproteobacteria bacterium]